LGRIRIVGKSPQKTHRERVSSEEMESRGKVNIRQRAKDNGLLALSKRLQGSIKTQKLEETLRS